MNGWLLAAVQLAALSLRRQPRDSSLLISLLVFSTALAVALAGMLTAVIWAEIDSSLVARVLGSVLVLDLLLAHQPILSRARPSLPTHRISIDLASGETVVLELEAADAANAAARAIRSLAPQEVARLSFDVDSRLPEPTSKNDRPRARAPA